MSRPTRAAWVAWRVLFLAQLREQPVRLIVTVIAIALGVALGAAVYLVNTAALNEFGLATKRLVGEADIIVRGPKEGFDEQLFARLANFPEVRLASPLLELDVALTGHNDTLKVLCLDPFRAAALQPALMAELGGAIFDLFEADALYLSGSAAAQLNVARGDTLNVTVGNVTKHLHVRGVLSQSAYPQPIGIMDIASAQWTLNKLGLVNRIDLQLNAGVDVEQFRRRLTAVLPGGVLAVAPPVERDRAVSVTRAYRVNLNMLALVSLWTGAFLVFSTQSLAALRRRRNMALLRAIGLTRGELQRALLGEGAVLGIVGSLIGVVLGAVAAGLILHFLTGDLGNGQLRVAGATLRAAPVPVLTFLALGTVVSCVGAWLPARSAAAASPARALKGGDADFGALARGGWRAGLALLCAGVIFALLPPVGGLPLFGYAAVGAMLFGAVMLVPSLTIIALKLTPRSGNTVLDTAVSQMRANVGLSTLSLASIIVSFSLMVAMAIMVYSFRVSFEHWLGKLLPADIQMREPYDNDTAYWSPADQRIIKDTADLARVEFRRTRRLLLDPGKAAITLIARGATPAAAADELPLTTQGTWTPQSAPPVFVSEALQDIYGVRVGGTLTLPLKNQQTFLVAGIWRDYARTSGAVVMAQSTYLAASGDDNANEASVWLKDGVSLSAATDALKAHVPGIDSVELISTAALRERSLQIFDRAFAVTYALELIAVLIGLTGVSFAASSTALARRAEFGMLRHIGMLRRQVIAMVASEGTLTSAFGVLYGLILGLALSLVLVYVINRQSFNWSIDLAIPVWQLALLSGVLIVAAAITAFFSGRAAMGQDAVRAVREDW
jgi:putative ABC transport system permease protein